MATTAERASTARALPLADVYGTRRLRPAARPGPSSAAPPRPSRRRARRSATTAAVKPRRARREQRLLVCSAVASAVTTVVKFCVPARYSLSAICTACSRDLDRFDLHLDLAAVDRGSPTRLSSTCWNARQHRLPIGRHARLVGRARRLDLRGGQAAVEQGLRERKPVRPRPDWRRRSA